MRILITGVSGFIGNHLANRMVALEHDVIGIDKKDLVNIQKFSELIKGKTGRFEFIKQDINDLDIENSVGSCDYIVHLAGESGVRKSWGTEFYGYVANNIFSTQKLLEFAIKKNVRRFVFASSSSVYGDCDKLPVTETASCKPKSPYGISKLTGEHLCSTYSRRFDLPVAIFRFFTVYGPGQRSNMLIQNVMNNLLYDKTTNILGNGNQSRDFIYISDLLDAITQSISLDLPQLPTLNLGSGQTYNILDTIKLIEKLSQRHATLSFETEDKSDVMTSHANIDSAKALLRWVPRTSLADGLLSQWKSTFQGTAQSSAS